MKLEVLINEIETTLQRTDIDQKEFVILHSLKYLLENGNFPKEQKSKRSAALPVKPAHVEMITSLEREREVKELIKNLHKPDNKL